jgi:2-C-methyl-D-erythritol 4-phosphate cytidylyltransferase
VKGAVAIVLAAGEGERLGRGPKAFLEIGGRSILSMAVAAAAACPEVDELVVAVPAGFEDRVGRSIGSSVAVGSQVVAGGRTRQESVRLALGAVAEDRPVVVCHDAARPFAAPELFSAVIDALADADGAVPVLPIADTVKRVRDGYVESTLAREELRLVQTPQAFAAPSLRDAHARAVGAASRFTDDAALLEWAGYRVRAVTGEPVNFKITTVEDLARAERFVLDTMPPVAPAAGA